MELTARLPRQVQTRQSRPTLSAVRHNPRSRDPSCGQGDGVFGRVYAREERARLIVVGVARGIYVTLGRRQA